MKFQWVTNEQYGHFIAATGPGKPQYWDDGEIPVGTEKFPVTLVSAKDADAYCRWAGSRLPTDSEAKEMDETRPPFLWEWTSDTETSYRVVRGGSWCRNPSGLRASVRYWRVLTCRDVNFGFRCASLP